MGPIFVPSVQVYLPFALFAVCVAMSESIYLRVNHLSFSDMPLYIPSV